MTKSTLTVALILAFVSAVPVLAQEAGGETPVAEAPGIPDEAWRDVHDRLSRAATPG